MTELAFDHNEPCYFAVAAMPLEMANNYLKVRTRNGSGLLKYWHVPVQFGAEVNSRLLPFLYIGAYARYLARAHHLDLNGWEAVLLAEKCIQCSPIEGDEVLSLFRTPCGQLQIKGQICVNLCGTILAADCRVPVH